MFDAGSMVHGQCLNAPRNLTSPTWVGVGMLRGEGFPSNGNTKDDWFLGCWFLGFFVSRFLGCFVSAVFGSLVSWFLGSLVSQFRRFKNHFMFF